MKGLLPAALFVSCVLSACGCTAVEIIPRCDEVAGKHGTLTVRAGLLSFGGAQLAVKLEQSFKQLPRTAQGVSVPISNFPAITLLSDPK